MAQDQTKDWRKLCQAAANEEDPKRLCELVAEIERTLQDKQDRLVAEICKRTKIAQ